MAFICNRPTDEGRQLGQELARFSAQDVVRLAALGIEDTRCASCAFRFGTVPNGCPSTLMDALKCTMEGEPFYCHTAPACQAAPLCQGYVMARGSLNGQTTKCPWEFSESPEKDPAQGDSREHV